MTQNPEKAVVLALEAGQSTGSLRAEEGIQQSTEWWWE
jgi:hypothetical protein